VKRQGLKWRSQTPIAVVVRTHRVMALRAANAAAMRRVHEAAVRGTQTSPCTP
jgi:hypothetical protein